MFDMVNMLTCYTISGVDECQTYHM